MLTHVDTRKDAHRPPLYTPTGLHCIPQTAMHLLKRHVFCQTMRISDERSPEEGLLVLNELRIVSKEHVLVIWGRYD